MVSVAARTCWMYVLRMLTRLVWLQNYLDAKHEQLRCQVRWLLYVLVNRNPDMQGEQAFTTAALDDPPCPHAGLVNFHTKAVIMQMLSCATHFGAMAVKQFWYYNRQNEYDTRCTANIGVELASVTVMLLTTVQQRDC